MPESEKYRRFVKYKVRPRLVAKGKELLTGDVSCGELSILIENMGRIIDDIIREGELKNKLSICALDVAVNCLRNAAIKLEQVTTIEGKAIRENMNKGGQKT